MGRELSREMTVTIDEVELEVMVFYYDVKPEPDVGEPGGVEIERVMYEDEGNILNRLSNDQVEELEIDILDKISDAWEYAQERRRGEAF